METEILKDVGLSDNEIRVYLALLKEEELTASEISKATKINRTLIYTLLDSLIGKGMVSYVIKSSIKYFRAGDPNTILAFLKEKSDNIRKIIPDLLKLKAPSRRRYSVELYEGAEGLKSVLDDILRARPKEFLDITSGSTVIVLPRYYMDKFHKEREKIIPLSRILYNHTKMGIKRAKEMKQYPRAQSRVLPKGLSSPSHIYVYADRVCLTLWEKDFPFAILIKSKDMAKRFKEFFEWFWQLSKPA